jgi:glyoxylase-like metal-dependent hydrolase (beta-lactamase superfamily II)
VLLENLQAAGFSHEDIEVVVLSHLHFDHAGGLLTAWQEGQAPALLFPNARYLVSAACWDRACQPHSRDRASFIAELPGLLKASGRLEIVDGEYSEALGHSVRFHYSDGHTPGLMLAEILGPQGEGGVVFCADLIPGRPWVHLPVTMGYDRYPERLIDEKLDFLAGMLERHVRLFFTHDVDCAMAEVRRDDKGRYSTTGEMPALAGFALAA